ncbi:MAG: hypothetical protein H6841_09690 [Planctomycetes bacterium]|nr:hypothetical protein [Planctomycetota bacterium]MCB9935403.1 hypothetical protein [Planctomycetota bacterium]
MAKKKLDLGSLEIPDEKKRRGSFIVRLALRRIALRQHRDALKAAARMVLLLPGLQAALLVGVLHAELWMLLLGLEGTLIAWLAAGQLSRPTPESRLIGFGIALLNVVLLSAVGLFLGSHLYWVTGLLGILPVVYLVFSRTGARTLKLAWVAYVLPLLLAALACGAGRAAMELSENETDPALRGSELQLAWYALAVRGGNGTERALLRLRQAQAAFEAGDYEAAWQLADDGLYDGRRQLRAIPASLIGADLVESLLRVKAQAFYNARWDKDGNIYQPITPEPLGEDSAKDPTVSLRWGW